MKYFITIGPSASGKSTWADDFISNNEGWVRIERDLIRLSLYGRENMYKGDENKVTQAQLDLIKKNILENKNIIISDTNLSKKRLLNLINNIKKLDQNAEISTKDFFDVPLAECISRDSKRSYPVGEDVIRRQFKLMLSEYKERFIPSYRLQNEQLKSCILIDVDNTICFMSGRSPYEWNRVDEDLPNTPIINMIKKFFMGKTTLIFFSGRDESCRVLTENYIKKHFNTEDFLLVMRPSGDMRKDSIVKKELYEKYIENKYFVEMIFDDRLDVCRMWYNDLKLPMCRVGDPDANF